MVFKRIYSLVTRAAAYEKSPRKLALTCALGIYIGISPLVGLHTAMVFAFGWMFALSIPILLSVSMMIHNPWTMMPVYAIDHIFGKWLFSVLDIDHMAWDPVWMESCNLFLKEQTGITGLSLSAFFVGGNLLAIGTSVMMYPIMKQIFIKYLNLVPLKTLPPYPISDFIKACDVAEASSDDWVQLEAPVKDIELKVNTYENNLSE